MSDPNLDDLRRNLADATLNTEQMGAEILGLRESVSELAIKRRVDEQHHILQRRMVEAKRDDWERLCLSYIERLHLERENSAGWRREALAEEADATALRAQLAAANAEAFARGEAVRTMQERLSNATQSTEEMAAEILGLRDTVSKLVTERDDCARHCLSYTKHLHDAEAERKCWKALAEVERDAWAQAAKKGKQ